MDSQAHSTHMNRQTTAGGSPGGLVAWTWISRILERQKEHYRLVPTNEQLEELLIRQQQARSIFWLARL